MHKEEVAFSLINICIVILIIIGLATLGFKYFRPSNYIDKNMREVRDSQRLSDVRKIETAIKLYIADGKNFDLLNTGKAYSSLDGSNAVDGSGWLPIDLSSISSGQPISELPKDPSDDQKYFYQVGFNVREKTFEVNCIFEAPGSVSKHFEDGGNHTGRYEIGSNLTILK